MSDAEHEVGPELVFCTVCDTQKGPWGRSAPMYSNYCDPDCPGHGKEPRPSGLWPGEKRCDFGYGVPCKCQEEPK